MNRKSGSGSGPFLMEMLVVVGFFIICASICIMVFVKSDNISREARDINQAVLMAQSLTEELKAGVDPQWSQQLPDRNIWQHLAEADGENEEYAEWNRSWKVTEPNLNTPYLGIIYQGTVDGMRRTDVLVLRYGRGDDKGELLYRLQTESYEAR